MAARAGETPGGTSASVAGGPTPQTAKLVDVLAMLKESDEVPTPYAAAATATAATSSSSSMSHNASAGAAAATANNTSHHESRQLQPQVSGEDANDVCNCRKSRCLKLYCQCFAASAACTKMCNCYSCANNKAHDELRKKAIRIILERNPNAFDSKFKTSTGGDTAVAHKVGCRCRKSMCLKKYCECYQAGVICSSTCTCLHCCNTGNSAAAILLQSQRIQTATPIPDNDDAIFKAAEELAFLSQQQKVAPAVKTESVAEVGARTKPLVTAAMSAQSLNKSSVSISRPPLPPNKRKRTDSDAGDQEGSRMSLRDNAIPPGRYSDMNDGRPPLPVGFSPIYPQDRVYRKSETQSQQLLVGVFDLRAASPTSINIASALSLLSSTSNNSDGANYVPLTTTAVGNNASTVPPADATSEEDNWSDKSAGSVSSPFCQGNDRGGTEENASRASSLCL